MFQGQLVEIYIGSVKRQNLQRVEQVEAIPERGLVGDRYFRRGAESNILGSPEQEVTLIEIEALEALPREEKLSLEPAQARRNLVTRGVPLNHLVNREFVVGEVVLRGIRLCEPCSHLESITVSGIQKALCHRGGLRAQILKGGVLRAGDSIRPREERVFRPADD